MTRTKLASVLLFVLPIALIVIWLWRYSSFQHQTEKRTFESPMTQPDTGTDINDLEILASVPANDQEAIEEVEAKLHVEGKFLVARQRGGKRYYSYLENKEQEHIKEEDRGHPK